MVDNIEKYTGRQYNNQRKGLLKIPGVGIIIWKTTIDEIN